MASDTTEKSLESALELKSISKYFSRKANNNSLIKDILFGTKRSLPKSSFCALSKLTFKVPKGACIGLIGLNGAGKSTLLQILAGTIEPSSGKVYRNGKIGALLELGSGFNPDFTGRENIYLNASIFGLSKEEINRKIPDILDFADIAEFVDQPVRVYSSGMLVRLAFSVIVFMNADILMIDEALAVVDAKFQSKCFRFLKNFNENGNTLIFVSHDLNSITRLCDSAILLDKGKIVSEGTPKDVINEYSKILTDENEDFIDSQKGRLSKKKLKNGTYSLSSKAKVIHREKMLEEENESNIYHSNEFSYGGKLGMIESVYTSDENNKRSKVFQSGSIFKIGFVFAAYSTISKPIYAITIKDTKGTQVFGQNTLFGNFITSDLVDNDQIEVTFNLEANLASGTYLVSAGVTQFNNKDELIVIHRRYDVIDLEITNLDGSFGVANCFCDIKQRSITPK